jgi:tetratricopeptide (TPR) repeat protein
VDAGCFSRVRLHVQRSTIRRYGKKVNQFNRPAFAGKPFGALLFSLLLFAIFLLLISVRLVAQTSAPTRKLIHGIIVTPQGKPAAGVMVEIRDLHGMQLGRDVTNGAGSFEINMAAEAGEYIVFAAKEQQITDERVALNRPDVAITIALPPASDVAPEPPQDTVSAAQLSIPAKARKHLQLANAQFVKQNLPAAAMEVDRALQVDPACAAAFSIRAFIKLAERDREGAVEDAKRAVLLDPHGAESFVALAMSYNALKEFQKAAEAARHALGIRPDSWQGRLELAKSLYREGQFVSALQELDFLNIDFPDVHLVRANVLMRLDRSSEAADEFEIFLRESPADERSEQIRRIVSSVRRHISGTAPAPGQE